MLRMPHNGKLSNMPRTVNEARGMIGLGPIQDGDSVLINDELVTYARDHLKCIPTIIADEPGDPNITNDPPPPRHIDIFSEAPIKPLIGGPPRRGKPKPPAPPIERAGSAEQTAAVHRAMDLARR